MDIKQIDKRIIELALGELGEKEIAELKELNFQRNDIINNHDCHTSPADGCAVCSQLTYPEYENLI